MITEMDVLEAWKYWRKKGLMPPPAKDVKDLRRQVIQMYTAIKHLNRQRFKEAIPILSSGRRWPTVYDITSAIKQQEILNR